jgi:hypothetical protein
VATSAPGEVIVATPSVLERPFQKLEAYCRERDWVGFDPYDALNSELISDTPLANSRIARLVVTQALKRSPVNFRPLLRVRPRRDPKATALFLMTYARRAWRGDVSSRRTADQLAERLLQVRSPGLPYWCWGYSFPWQTRHELVPRFAPNLVGTVFAANALLDAFELGSGRQYLVAAASAGEYLANELYWEDRDCAAFAYPLPNIRVPIHNANFLGAALLCRLAKLTGEKKQVDIALRVTRYSASCQREDGSWTYGSGSKQQWVDNFHTGYNLCALESIREALGSEEFDSTLTEGFRFYRENFFTKTGVAKYFHNRVYPIDIHSVAQSVVTLRLLARLRDDSSQAARRVLEWAIAHMWDERGFFYYRKLRIGTIRTSYMRWSQAWMLYALTVLLADEGASDSRETPATLRRTRVVDHATTILTPAAGTRMRTHSG